MDEHPNDEIEHYRQRMNELMAERDRLRAVVEQALNLGEDEGMRRGKTPYPDWWVLLDRALDSRRQFDVSADIGGTES